MASGRFITQEGRRALFSILPPFGYVVLFMALPLIAVVVISFQLRSGGYGFGNFATVFSEPINVLGVVRDAPPKPDWLPSEFLWGLWIRIVGLFNGTWMTGLLPRSVFVSISVTAVTVILAYPIAYFISFKVEPSRKSLWLFLITIPFWTSYLIRIFLWKVILGYSGVVNTALMGMGLIDEPLTFILYNANAVVITLAHAYAPFAILPIFVALEKIDRSLKEAAQDLGENRFTTFLRVTLPLSVPGIVAAVLIVFIPTIGDYVTPELLGGPNGMLISNRIQALFLQVNDPGMGAALSIVTMATVGIVSLIFVALLGRWMRKG